MQERDERTRQGLIELTIHLMRHCEEHQIGEVPKIVLRFKDEFARRRFASMCQRAFEPLTGPHSDKPECLRFSVNSVSFSLEVGNADQ